MAEGRASDVNVSRRKRGKKTAEQMYDKRLRSTTSQAAGDRFTAHNLTPKPSSETEQATRTDVAAAGHDTGLRVETTVASVKSSGKGSNFEEELEWCIAQLELGILRKEASKTQKKDNERNIKILRSSKTPLPRKRQLMRSLFGDYRTKIKSHPLVQKEPSIVPIEPRTCETSGKFFKQSTAHRQRTNPHSVKNGLASAILAQDVPRNVDFRFEFEIS